MGMAEVIAYENFLISSASADLEPQNLSVSGTRWSEFNGSIILCTILSYTFILHTEKKNSFMEILVSTSTNSNN